MSDNSSSVSRRIEGKQAPFDTANEKIPFFYRWTSSRFRLPRAPLQHLAKGDESIV